MRRVRSRVGGDTSLQRRAPGRLDLDAPGRGVSRRIERAGNGHGGAHSTAGLRG